MLLVNSGGYDNLKRLIRELLEYEELQRSLREYDVRIVVAADSDMRPRDSIRGLLSSMNLKVQEDNVITVEFPEGVKLRVYVIEQGSEEGILTGEIEDELSKLVEELRSDLRFIVEKIEEIHGLLDNKQRLLVYIALSRSKPKIRSVQHEIKILLDEADVNVMRRCLKGIVGGLEEALV